MGQPASGSLHSVNGFRWRFTGSLFNQVFAGVYGDSHATTDQTPGNAERTTARVSPALYIRWRAREL